MFPLIIFIAPVSRGFLFSVCQLLIVAIMSKGKELNSFQIFSPHLEKDLVERIIALSRIFLPQKFF